ncbi:YjbH domain-containing protein [Bacteroides sp. 519]|uniref:YjbH domain-containing protein n=1 Tax=Bacteroides sp. 519 TaxID=2302937 RepID=UPI0013D4B189|nr:YjbH domain-containing protein [Bacteroides sp. 519]
MNVRLLIIFFSISTFSIIAKAQYSMGLTGQLNIPTAELNETGTFMGGFNFLPEKTTPDKFDYNTWNYFVNMTFFSFLEINYKCTLIKGDFMSNKYKFREQDRSFSAKLRLLQEGKYLPAIAVGVNDPLKQGMNYFASLYGVLTKNLLPKSEHKLALSLGYYHGLNSSTLQDGLFGGIRYTPAFLKQISAMAEYDSQGFNLGIAAKVWKHLSMHIFTHEFKCVSGGIRYEYTLIH